MCAVRRRRDVTADAPSSGSRVRLCSLHHVTPADGAPRWCMTACVACFFPDHRLSISSSIRVGTLGADALVLLVHSCSDGETSTPHLAHGAGGACRTAPIRWWRRCAKARLLGTRTLHHLFLRRAVDTRTRSFCRTSLRSRSAFGRSANPFAIRACSARRPPTVAHACPSRRRARTSSRRAGVRRHAVALRCGDGCARSCDRQYEPMCAELQ